MSKWISVDERVPDMKEAYKDGTKSARVLCWSGHHCFEGTYEETYKKRIPIWKNARGYNDADSLDTVSEPAGGSVMYSKRRHPVTAGRRDVDRVTQEFSGTYSAFRSRWTGNWRRNCQHRASCFTREANRRHSEQELSAMSGLFRRHWRFEIR